MAPPARSQSPAQSEDSPSRSAGQQDPQMLPSLAPTTPIPLRTAATEVLHGGVLGGCAWLGHCDIGPEMAIGRGLHQRVRARGTCGPARGLRPRKEWLEPTGILGAGARPQVTPCYSPVSPSPEGLCLSGRKAPKALAWKASGSRGRKAPRTTEIGRPGLPARDAPRAPVHGPQADRTEATSAATCSRGRGQAPPSPAPGWGRRTRPPNGRLSPAG